jgi:hypothetical protein
MSDDRLVDEKFQGTLWVGPMLAIPVVPSAQAVSRALPLLARAHELVSKPGGWTQGVFARAGNGRPVPLTSEKAVRFCISGAVLRAANEAYPRLQIDVSSDGGTWFEQEPYRLPAGPLAALWGLAYTCAAFVWAARPTVEAQDYASAGEESVESFAHLAEAVNDAEWMNARLAGRLVAATPPTLAKARELERRRHSRKSKAGGGAS